MNLICPCRFFPTDLKNRGYNHTEPAHLKTLHIVKIIKIIYLRGRMREERPPPHWLTSHIPATMPGGGNSGRVSHVGAGAPTT